ncbi:hemerythrin domain-containing protein [Streptomyces sp. NPDC015127]|uniref:hemerythrin domain-containing protein n=1 Tax=Streptomyces sp. NPDC015127 TaxID=3364939 RepID=UPI0036FF087E
MGHGGNVIGELTTDHREVDALFERIDGLPAADPKRRELADQLTLELVRHSVAEEQYLYPAVRRYVDGGDDLADQELADHAEIEHMLKELEACRPVDDRFDALLAGLRTSVTSHVQEEENRLFPLLADSCSANALDELGGKIRSAKSAAPTRPHPSGADSAPANKILAPGASMVDQLRDILTGRGHH